MMNNMFKIFQRYKKTNFVGGDLKIKPFSEQEQLKANKNFKAPRKLDFRDMCIETSNQDSTPHCAGYSMAGMLEVDFWRKEHYPKQFPGDKIYYEAKDIDGNDTPGTSLDSAAKAVINLQLENGKIKFIPNIIESIKFCIHTNLAFVGGFQITSEWNEVHKKTGKIVDHGDNAKQLGGHAVLICGYDEEGVYIQNSWGTTWGLWGFGLIPWDKVTEQFMHGVVII